MRQGKGKFTMPSVYIYVQVAKTKQIMINPTPQEFTCGKLMIYYGGYRATVKLAHQNLDQLGYIKSHSAQSNSDKRIKCM